MKAHEVPIVLYNEFSQQFGTRKGGKNITRNKPVYSKIRNLNSNPSGFPGAIGLQLKQDNPNFRYWSAIKV